VPDRPGRTQDDRKFLDRIEGLLADDATAKEMLVPPQGSPFALKFRTAPPWADQSQDLRHAEDERVFKVLDDLAKARGMAEPSSKGDKA
jgi:hypothetical protein